MHVASRQSAAASEPPHPPPDLPDLDVIKAVEHGNREMFEVIVRRYNPRLYRVGMAYLQDHALSEDAMQNAYVKAFLNLHRFRRASAFGTWLTRIMINECLMILRSKKRLTMHSLDDGETPLDDERLAAATPDALHAEDIRAVIENALQALPRTHRAVYILREVQQLSTDETAQCLGLSRENVKVSLHRAREGLKAQVLKSAAGAELFDYPAQYCDPLTERVMRSISAKAASARGAAWSMVSSAIAPRPRDPSVKP